MQVPAACGAPSSLPAPGRQTLFTVEPLGLFPVDRDAVPTKQDVQPSIAEPPALLRQFAKPRPQFTIICPARAIPHARAVRPDDDARPPLAHPQRRLEMRDRLPLRGGRYHFFDSRSFRPALSSIVSASSSLEPCVLLLERPQTLRVGHFQTAEFRLPRVVGRARHPVLPTQLGHHCARLGLLQDADDLLFRELLPLHSVRPFEGPVSRSRWMKKRGARHARS